MVLAHITTDKHWRIFPSDEYANFGIHLTPQNVVRLSHVIFNVVAVIGSRGFVRRVTEKAFEPISLEIFAKYKFVAEKSKVCVYVCDLCKEQIENVDKKNRHKNQHKSSTTITWKKERK